MVNRGTVIGVHCPACEADDTRVIDSRLVEDGAAVRRRRTCSHCGDRFTTFERFEARVVTVRKRDGACQPFSQENIVSGVLAASKGRPVTVEQAVNIASSIEAVARRSGGTVEADWIGVQVLDALSNLDEVAWLRFASVYENFEELSDFQRAAGLMDQT